jgi:hypothetical protein
MDVNSNLLRPKLDMVYHDVTPEEAQKRYAEATQAPDEKAFEPITTVQGPEKPKPKRKTVKALVPKK